MDIYLDINGVLLTRDLQPARHLGPFLDFVTKKHTCLWLTTHCRGDENRTLDVLGPALDARGRMALGRILPTDWRTLKTEAILWDRDFRWLDDTLLEAERSELSRHLAMDRFIQVDLERDPDVLKNLMDRL